MVKKSDSILTRFLHFLGWLTGVIVSLAVAFGMIEQILTLEYLGIPNSVTIFFGWVVVVTTFIGVIIAIVKYIK